MKMNIKHFKLNFQKIISLEKEINLEQYNYDFELHFSSSTEEFDDYINQGMFYYFESNEGNVCIYYDPPTKITFVFFIYFIFLFIFNLYIH